MYTLNINKALSQWPCKQCFTQTTYSLKHIMSYATGKHLVHLMHLSKLNGWSMDHESVHQSPQVLLTCKNICKMNKSKIIKWSTHTIRSWQYKYLKGKHIQQVDLYGKIILGCSFTQQTSYATLIIKAFITSRPSGHGFKLWASWSVTEPSLVDLVQP